MAGSSGMKRERFCEVTAIGRTWPALSGPVTEAAVVIIICRLPPIMSVTALEMPL